MRYAFALALTLVVGACSTAPAPQVQILTAPPVATEAPVTELAGTIEFGTAFDPDTLVMTEPTSRFKRTYSPISYVIHLSGPAGATELTATLTRRASGGVETTIDSVPMPIANPDFDTFANAADLAASVGNTPGTYVMRVIREGTVLAEGTFTLV